MGKGLSSKVFKKGDLVRLQDRWLGIVVSQDGILVEVYWVSYHRVPVRHAFAPYYRLGLTAVIPAYKLKRIEDEA